jgi:hypothetical protein
MEPLGVTISTQRQPPRIELRYGGQVLHMIGEHAVSSGFATPQYLTNATGRVQRHKASP